jgi:hypothetical protein
MAWKISDAFAATVLVMAMLLGAEAQIGFCVPLSNNSICAPFIPAGQYVFMANAWTVKEREEYARVQMRNTASAGVFFPNAAAWEYVSCYFVLPLCC